MSNPVSITDLLTAIGSENIKFQYLATCMEGIKSAKGRNLITFGTDALTPTDAVQDTGPRGLIVWVDKELMRKRLDEIKAGSGQTMDQAIQQRDESRAEAATWEQRAVKEASANADLVQQRDALIVALQNLMLFSNPTKSNAVALHNAHQVIAKVEGGAA